MSWYYFIKGRYKPWKWNDQIGFGYNNFYQNPLPNSISKQLPEGIEINLYQTIVMIHGGEKKTEITT